MKEELTGRLFVIRAKDAPTAIILRRGPSAWYHLIQWNLRSDSFTHGAWVRGRIYEEKCDLSSNGGLFVYSIYKTLRIDGRSYACFTAVSRPPWLKALVVWPQSSTYEGGGRFFGPNILRVGVDSEPWPELPIGLTLDHRCDAAGTHQSTKEIEAAEWCGYDHRDRVIYTIGGKLYRKGKKVDQLVADFSDLKPDPQPAPEWAGRPLGGEMLKT